jgi:hypothetical protein
MPGVGAVEIVGLGPVAVATTLWRSLGILRATAVVKATFDFVPGGAMTIAESTPLVGVEAHHARNPMRSIRASGELSPFLKKADVLFVGRAYPPGGAPSPRSMVRLAVVRNGWALIDKTLTVIGDRAATTLEPTPFQQMPIVYERAFGGLGHAENPLGAGVEPAKGRSLPNFAHSAGAAGERTDPAGFGPISWSWPARRSRLRGYPRKHLSEPVVELPADFDFEFFQASPPDQRTTYLRGDEVLVLEGLHPSHPRLETALPGVRGAARVYTPDGIEINLTLHADTLYIDGDAEQCSITWRGSFPVASEEAIEGLRVLAGVDTAAKPIDWPTPSRLEAAAHPVASPDTAPLPGWESTYALSESKGAAAGSLAAPFAIPAPGASQPSAYAPIPGAPWAPEAPSPRVVEESNLDGTRVISDEKSTQILSAASLLSAAPAPFTIAAPGAARGGSTAPIPGAPWAPSSARRPPLPKPRVSLETTVTIDAEALEADDDDDEDVTLKAPSIPRRAPPPAPPSAAPSTQDAPDASKPTPAAPVQAEPARPWSWVSVAPAPSTLEKAPAPRAMPPKPVLSKKLYGGFGSKKT